MKKSLFTIYDTKTEAYFEPTTIDNEKTMIRALKETLANPEHQFAKYPMDFSLFRIGKFSQETGQIEACPPEFVCNLHELLKEEDEKVVNFGGTN